MAVFFRSRHLVPSRSLALLHRQIPTAPMRATSAAATRVSSAWAGGQAWLTTCTLTIPSAHCASVPATSSTLRQTTSRGCQHPTRTMWPSSSSLRTLARTPLPSKAI
ncbi:hypothetical protein BN1708_019575, partial [Verticillium longisporum]